ncbi:aminoacyl--tRNA ligase-related protein [Nocardia gipuzkoensis]
MQDDLGKNGHVQVELPALMSDNDLQGGEAVGRQFASKLFGLANLPGYHLLSTPEMLFVRASQTSVHSYRELPLRRSYTTNFFRRAHGTKGLLVCRQFRIVGTASLELDTAAVRVALNEVIDTCTSVLKELGVEVVRLDDGSESARTELCYPTREGDLWIGSPDRRSRALSLAIGFQYASGSRLPVRYRTADNRNSAAQMATFGLCSNRVLHSAFDASRDRWGFALPHSIKPVDVVVIPRNSRANARAAALASGLESANVRVGLDDRFSKPTLIRQEFAYYIGADVAIIVTENAFRVENCLGRRVDEHCVTIRGIVTSTIDRI